MYFVIHISEDGDMSIDMMDAPTLAERLKGREDEGPYYGTNKCHTKIPANSDPMLWGSDRLLIIKGDVIVPKPKDIVKSFDIP